jgi:hypothetical protein
VVNFAVGFGTTVTQILAVPLHPFTSVSVTVTVPAPGLVQNTCTVFVVLPGLTAVPPITQEYVLPAWLGVMYVTHWLSHTEKQAPSLLFPPAEPLLVESMPQPDTNEGVMTGLGFG